MRKILTLFLLFCSSFSLAAPKVVATTKPLHSLVSQIMADVGEVDLLMSEGTPHNYNLKPANVKMLSNADILIWTSNELEVFMPDVAKKTLPDKIIVWQKLPEIKLIKAEDEDEHHHNSDFNPHIWLSTKNAEVLLKNVALELIDLDPTNQEKYRDNLQKSLANLEKLRLNLEKKLEPIKFKAFIVFHDAYPYFVEEFKLNQQDIVKADVEHEISPKKIAELENKITELNITCIFNEPQFNSSLVEKLAENKAMKVAVLDPIGADLKAGKSLYNQLMNNLANSLNNCLNNEE